MPHVLPCHSLPPPATPRVLPSQPHLFKLAAVPTDQQSASRPGGLGGAHPLRVQTPPRPSSTAIQSPALCFHPPPRPSSDPTDTRAQVSQCTKPNKSGISLFGLAQAHVRPAQPTSVAVITPLPSANASKLGGDPTSAAERTNRESSSQQMAFPSAVNWQIPRESSSATQPTPSDHGAQAHHHAEKARAPHAVPPLHLRPRALTPRPPGQMPFTSAGPFSDKLLAGPLQLGGHSMKGRATTYSRAPGVHGIPPPNKKKYRVHVSYTPEPVPSTKLPDVVTELQFPVAKEWCEECPQSLVVPKGDLPVDGRQSQLLDLGGSRDEDRRGPEEIELGHLLSKLRHK
ncbi:hypothetical protein EDB84DRAFT_1441798 [Lactarius hengduanensis]|nr:hypothetical protein EDB84DRAFT_1441798 [Lactarius hengduanensis]